MDPNLFFTFFLRPQTHVAIIAAIIAVKSQHAVESRGRMRARGAIIYEDRSTCDIPRVSCSSGSPLK